MFNFKEGNLNKSYLYYVYVEKCLEIEHLPNNRLQNLRNIHQQKYRSSNNRYTLIVVMSLHLDSIFNANSQETNRENVADYGETVGGIGS